MITTHTKECDCGKPITYEVDDSLKNWDRPMVPWECTECEKARLEEHRRRSIAEHETEAKAFLAGFLPPRMEETDRSDSRFNARLWEKVAAWHPTSEKPWLGIIGPTGKCKTRVAYERLVDGILAFDQTNGFQMHAKECKRHDGRHWYVLDLSAVDFARAVRSQYGGDKTAADAVSLISKAHTVRWLLLDDLGKSTHTPAVAAELFSLIDHRHAHNLPTIWTANSRPEIFLANMPGDVADPLRGRLLECSTIFELK